MLTYFYITASFIQRNQTEWEQLHYLCPSLLSALFHRKSSHQDLGQNQIGLEDAASFIPGNKLHGEAPPPEHNKTLRGGRDISQTPSGHGICVWRGTFYKDFQRGEIERTGGKDDLLSGDGGC